MKTLLTTGLCAGLLLLANTSAIAGGVNQRHGIDMGSLAKVELLSAQRNRMAAGGSFRGMPMTSGSGGAGGQTIGDFSGPHMRNLEEAYIIIDGPVINDSGR